MKKFSGAGPNLTKPSGVALIVGLIFLIILTLFVLGSLRDVLMQERMSGSFRNQSLAESSSESLLRNGESRIFDNVVTLNGLVEFPGLMALDTDQAVAPNALLRSFRTGAGYPAGAAGAFQPQLISQTFQNTADNTSSLSKSGAYVIEGPISVNPAGIDLLESHTGNTSTGGSTGKLYMYRITSRATGGTDDYVRAAESFFLVSR
jgi:type IV pilus assembly protein PilX